MSTDWSVDVVVFLELNWVQKL